MSLFPAYPSELLAEIEHRKFYLGDSPNLFDPGNNSSSQQGDPVIKIYSNIYLWHTQSIAATADSAIASTFIDGERIPRIQRLGVLRRYPALPVPGYVTSIDYIFTGKNYYHYLVDAMPRLWALRHPCFAKVKPHVFLDSGVPSYLRRFVRMVFPEFSYVVLPRYFRIFCRNYIHLPFLSKDRTGFAPNDSQTSGGFIPNEYLGFFRDRVSSLLGNSLKQTPRNIYIKRGNTKVRRVLNEGKVVEKLERNGFYCVDLAELSLLEQAHLFLNAEVIAGAHGAGFTNLLYCHGNKVKVFEIYPSSNDARHYYSLYSQAAGLDYHSIYLNESHISRNFHVPDSTLDEILGST